LKRKWKIIYYSFRLFAEHVENEGREKWGCVLKIGWEILIIFLIFLFMRWSVENLLRKNSKIPGASITIQKSKKKS
jgi:hypothetical protein